MVMVWRGRFPSEFRQAPLANGADGEAPLKVVGLSCESLCVSFANPM